jgi:hypothetical protein
MANIQPVTTNDTQAINKVNAAIAEANKVAGKADQGALNDEAAARADAVNREATARQAADQREAEARAKADAAEAEARVKGDAGEAAARREADEIEEAARLAGDMVRATFADVASGTSRPGESGNFFAGSVDGEADKLTPISAKATSPQGAVAVLEGAGTVASIAAFRIEPGRQYSVRFAVQRATDTDDPSNDAIRLGARWLKGDKGGLATVELANLLDVTVSDGRLEYVFNLAAQDAQNIDAVSPASAVYFRPFVRTFGNGVTHVEVIEVVDLTTSIDWSPDVSQYRREVAGLVQIVRDLQDRIQTLEAQP